MANVKNTSIVTSLKEKVSRAKSVVLTDYCGLTHKQSEELHRAVKKVEGEFVVVKNSLFKLASTDYGLPSTALTGPTAVLLSYGDEIAPLKELAKFMKATTLPKIKAGFIEGQILDESGVIELSKLPGKDVMRQQVVSRFSGPIYGLVYSLNYNLQKLVYVLGQIKKE